MLIDHNSCGGTLVRCSSFVVEVLTLVRLILAVALAHPHLAGTDLLRVDVVYVLFTAPIDSWF